MPLPLAVLLDVTIRREDGLRPIPISFDDDSVDEAIVPTTVSLFYVFAHLVNNAVETAASVDGHVRIRVRWQIPNSMVRIVIENDGEVLTEERWAHLRRGKALATSTIDKEGSTVHFSGGTLFFTLRPLGGVSATVDLPAWRRG